MGLDVYIGPAITATLPKAKVVVVTKLGCSYCFREQSSLYCPTCGSKRAEFQVEKKEFPNYYDILEEDPDVFFPLTQNHKEVEGAFVAWGANRRGWALNLENLQQVNLLGLNLQQEADKFAANYAKEIELLKQHYDNVQVAWGAYQYYL